MINTSSTLETISSGRVFVKRTRAQSKLLHTWIISVTCAPRVPHCLPRSSATPAFGLRVSSCGFRGFEVSRFRGFKVSRFRGFEVSRFRGFEASRFRGFGFRVPRVPHCLLHSPAMLHGKRTKWKPLWQWGLLHSMFFTGNFKEVVQ